MQLAEWSSKRLVWKETALSYTTGLLRILVWPAVALVMFFAARKPLSKLIEGLRPSRAVTPVGTFEFGASQLESNAEASSPELSSRLENTPRPGNVYWLGHDLMWTIDVTLRGANRDTVVHGLTQSLHHLRSVGLANTPQEGILSKLLARTSEALENELDESFRMALARDVGSVVLSVGRIARAAQDDFKASPTD